MNLKRLKLELFHLRKAHWQYHQLGEYIKNRFFLNKKILHRKEPLERPTTFQNLSIHTMLGHQHLLMALWSLGSFYAVSKSIGKLYLQSDGTLTAYDKSILRKFFPSAELVDPVEVLTKYADKFSHYPAIADFRVKYKKNFFQTKLIDPFVIPESDIRLFFDIDILWFQHSELIEREIRSDNPHSLMMTGTFGDAEGDVDSNTVYFRDGSKLPREYSSYNGGIMLYHKNNMPAPLLTKYLETLDMTRAESWHWVEQAGYAYTLQNLQKLPVNQFPIKGKVDEGVIARHYTGPRRVEFYTEGLPKAYDLLWNTK